MSFTVGVHHETEEGDGHIDLKFTGVDVSGGHSGSRHYPGHPPDVTFKDCEIEHDELDRDLEAVHVFEAHDTHFVDALQEKYSKDYEARKADYADYKRDCMIDEGRI